MTAVSSVTVDVDELDLDTAKAAVGTYEQTHAVTVSFGWLGETKFEAIDADQLERFAALLTSAALDLRAKTRPTSSDLDWLAAS